jgi:carbonic anhydrase
MPTLLEGVQRFQREAFAPRRDLFERLAGGQRPETLFITCSDSRIDPNLLTQTQPGELFVLRNAGNLVPPYGAVDGGEAATIEFAVAGLGVRQIVVCGHSQCGAMDALLAPEKVRDLPALTSWLKHAAATRSIVRGRTGAAGALLDLAIEQNVLVQLANLRTHPVVAAAVAAGSVSLEGWVYSFQHGQVRRFDDERGVFVAIDGGSAPVDAAAPLQTANASQ